MKETEPLYRCTGCQRGVLNRSVARCLYCGAELPAQARLKPEAIAARDAEHARLEARRARQAAAQPQQADTSPGVLDVIEGAAAGDLIDMVGDGIAALGDLLN